MNFDSAVYKSITVIEEVRTSQEMSISLLCVGWFYLCHLSSTDKPDRDTGSKHSHAGFHALEAEAWIRETGEGRWGEFYMQSVTGLVFISGW